MTKSLLSPILFLFFLQNFQSSSIAQPANDGKCGAVPITVGTGCTDGDNTGATTTGEGLSTPSCFSGNPSNYSTSVWYSFTATDDSISINFGDGTLGTQSMGAVYSSSDNTCSGTFTEVGCAKGGNEVELLGLINGNTYFIMVDGSGNNVGTFCVSAYETPPPPPPIGTCSNPRDLQAAGDCNNISGVQYDEQNNIISTSLTTGGDGGANASGYGNPEGLDGACAGSDAGQDAYWVRFSGTVTNTGSNSTETFISNPGTNPLDYALFRKPLCTATCITTCPDLCSNLIAVACYTIAAGGTQEITISKDSTYMLMITNTSTNSTTTRNACITSDVPYVPPNNACANATTITANVNYIMNSGNATVDGKLCSGSVENNIWAKWTVPGTWTGSAYVHLYNQDCACGNGTQMSVMSAGQNCSNISSPTCVLTINPNNDNDFNGQFTPTAGQTYYFNLDGYAGCGCTFDFEITGTSVVPEPVFANAGNDQTICNGNNTIIGGAPTGPAGSTYLWSPSTGLSSTTVANPTAAPITTTTYTVTVTDLGGCTASDAVIITVNNCCGTTLTTVVTDVTCPGASTGAINLTVTLGTAPYTYAWSTSATTEDVTLLPAGTYTVTVIDATPCTVTATATVIAPTAWSISSAITNVVCPCDATGAINLSVSGATGPYTYLWSNAATTEDLSSIVDGTYTVTVTDTKSCTATYSTAITEPAQLLISLNSQTNLNCFGESTGQFIVQAGGGAGPYDYSSNGGGTWNFSDVASGTPVTYSGLTAGSYTITVRDANSCLTH